MLAMIVIWLPEAPRSELFDVLVPGCVFLLDFIKPVIDIVLVARNDKSEPC